MSRSTRSVLLFSVGLALAGCNAANGPESQYDDARNPKYKQAQQDLDANNPAAAVADYEAALAINPKLANAHYELGSIYGDKLADPVGAIFHYRKFLELAPTSDKSEQAKTLIDKQSQAFSASLPNSPTQSAEDYAKLQGENATLRKQVEDANKAMAQMQGKHHPAMVTSAPAPAPAPAPPTPPPVPVPNTSYPPTSAVGTPPPAMTTVATTESMSAPVAPPKARALNDPNPAVETTTASTGTSPSSTTTAAATGEARSYKIVAGDSLWKIAHKMYPGDTKGGIEKIQEANKDTMPPGKPLKIGQVLIIP